MIVTGLDDVSEDWLEGSTTNEETIDVGLADKLSGVGISHGSTVQNSSFICGLLAHILGEP